MTTNIKQKQLQLLLNDFELLSKTALTQIQITGKLLEDNTINALYEEAEANEVMMDRLEIKVREEVVFTILQFNPIAADLRKIITYQDITTNLERVGDMLLNIIHYLRETDLCTPQFAEEKKKVVKMVNEVSEMLHNSIYSFMNGDVKLAYKTIKDDDKVDDMYHKINKELETSFSNKPLTQEVLHNIIVISRIAHNLERIGDSSTNIAEAAVYLTEGKDIRHGNEK
ncbi:MAG: phosphate signaling complex PhoU family protein [Dysgonomonas sp.]